MRNVVRVAAYVPSTVADGVPVGAPDEDEFTFAATAMEHAWFGRRDEPGAVAVHLLGKFPPVAEWGFSPLLGRATRVVHHPADSGELASTLRELEEDAGGPAFMVGAELPERGRVRSGRSPGRGAAAFAYLLEDSETPSPLPLPKSPATRSAVTTTMKFGSFPEELPRSVTLVGDWDPRVAGGPSIDRKLLGKFAETNLDAVSEGAYVPHARYLENLPSRWRFVAESCAACAGTTFPARGVCRQCGRRDKLTALALPYEGGRVVAVTTVGKGGQPTEFDAQVATFGPYDVALVELARGMRVTLQVTDAPPGTVRVGGRVDTRLRRLYPMEGEWRYGRKAVPVAPHRVPTAGT